MARPTGASSRSRRACRPGRAWPSSRRRIPERFIDVGIAEQHAVTLATGLALGGMRPVVALYSTFLQRAFDQTVHDVCQNDAPVLLAVDRAGLVGEDGTSHQGMFTVPAQRMLPNLVVASPRDEQELRALLRTALARTTRSRSTTRAMPGSASRSVSPRPIPVGRGEVLREGRDLLFVTFGPITGRALEVADALEARGWSVGVINARFVKPLDRQLILDQARGKSLLVTFEESVVTGGFGSAVLEAVEEARLADPAYRSVPVRLIGIPGDRFVDHGSVTDLRRLIRLDVPGLTAQVTRRWPSSASRSRRLRTRLIGAGARRPGGQPRDAPRVSAPYATIGAWRRRPRVGLGSTCSSWSAGLRRRARGPRRWCWRARCAWARATGRGPTSRPATWSSERCRGQRQRGPALGQPRRPQAGGGARRLRDRSGRPRRPRRRRVDRRVHGRPARSRRDARVRARRRVRAARRAAATGPAGRLDGAGQRADARARRPARARGPRGRRRLVHLAAARARPDPLGAARRPRPDRRRWSSRSSRPGGPRRRAASCATRRSTAG